jgi:hypothetical protein
MKISPMPGKELRSKLGSIATAIAFACVLGSVAVGSARAADNRGHDARGGDRHADNHDHRGGRGHAVYQAQPDNYYLPPPNYYAAPEPYYYDAPQPAPEGINLFFGL